MGWLVWHCPGSLGRWRCPCPWDLPHPMLLRFCLAVPVSLPWRGISPCCGTPWGNGVGITRALGLFRLSDCSDRADTGPSMPPTPRSPTLTRAGASHGVALAHPLPMDVNLCCPPARHVVTVSLSLSRHLCPHPVELPVPSFALPCFLVPKHPSWRGDRDAEVRELTQTQDSARFSQLRHSLLSSRPGSCWEMPLSHGSGHPMAAALVSQEHPAPLQHPKLSPVPSPPLPCPQEGIPCLLGAAKASSLPSHRPAMLQARKIRPPKIEKKQRGKRSSNTNPR